MFHRCQNRMFFKEQTQQRRQPVCVPGGLGQAVGQALQSREVPGGSRNYFQTIRDNLYRLSATWDNMDAPSRRKYRGASVAAIEVGR